MRSEKKKIPQVLDYKINCLQTMSQYIWQKYFLNLIVPDISISLTAYANLYIIIFPRIILILIILLNF